MATTESSGKLTEAPRRGRALSAAIRLLAEFSLDTSVNLFVQLQAQVVVLAELAERLAKLQALNPGLSPYQKRECREIQVELREYRNTVEDSDVAAEWLRESVRELKEKAEERAKEAKAAK